MFLEIKGLLQPPEVQRLIELSKIIQFVDGRATNPGNTGKDNLQADTGDPNNAESTKIVSDALSRSREFRDFAFPRRVAPPLLSRYEPGMKYGAHADSAFMAMRGGPLRSDVSCTVFISDPASYEGGELTIHLGVRALPLKGQAGDAIVYPSTTLHEVRPVRSGVRLVSLTFIESYIADQQQRALVYELGEVSALEGNRMDWINRMRLEAVRQNLIRMWSA